MNIQVTQNHINKGVPIRSRECPIALALKETFPMYDFNVYSTFIVYSQSEMHEKIINLDKDSPIRSFVEKMDTNQKVSPFTFEFDINSGQ